MKKFIIMSLVLMFMLSSVALATSTRVMTMGNVNTVVLDDANILEFPSRVVEYPNIALGEFNSGDDFHNFGMIWKFDDESKWVMGTFVSTLSGEFYGIPNFSVYNNRKFDFFYGREMGNNNFGIHLNYNQAGQEFIDSGAVVANNYNESVNHIDLTVGLTEGSGQWDVAVNFGFGSWTNEVADTTQNEPDGFSNMGVMARYFKSQGPNYTLIPHFGFMTEKIGVKYPDGTTESEKNSFFVLGCGVNYTPSNNVLAVFDFGFHFDGYKYEYSPNGGTATEDKYTYNAIPYFKLGLDAEVFKWLDVRMGAESYWESDKYEYSNTDEYTVKYASNETYIGLGMNWGKLHIDTYTDPQFFLSGPDFISGNGYDMAYMLTALYEL